MKVLLTNEDGTSMILLGTSAWDTEDSLSARWVCSICSWIFLICESEVSLQLQRFFNDCVNLFEGIRMRSVVVSCWDEDVKEAFQQGAMELEKSWRYGTTFRL
jgi:hypothetical protein